MASEAEQATRPARDISIVRSPDLVAMPVRALMVRDRSVAGCQQVRLPDVRLGEASPSGSDAQGA